MAMHLVLLPGEFTGQRNLVGYGPWDCKELDTTKQLKLSLSFNIIFNVFSNFNTFPI